jgi:serine/threonine-protein kinase HipA
LKKLRVIYCGWGERWLLGTLAQTDRDVLFEYSPQALARGLQLSPLHQPLPRAGASAIAYRGEASFHRLPGFIADALPDGWGLLLMDRALRKLKRDPRTVSVLDRLAMVGERAIGALAFEPSEEDLLPAEQLQLKALAEAINAVRLDQENDTVQIDAQLRHLMQLGGSPQGARPKVLVDFNPRTGKLTSGKPLTGVATPWLVKFPAQGEHREVCAIEELYARIARHGGMAMPRSKFFDLGPKHSAFGVERFDRFVKDKQVARVPVLSLSGYLEADHRIPALDYETILLATLQITGDRREVVKAFERCVFNVMMRNRDDHSRNFAFRMDEQGLWKLAPAFDLTCSFGPGGEHATSVAGHGKNIKYAHLLQVAKAGGIAAGEVQRCIKHWAEAAGAMSKFSRELAIRKTSLTQITKQITEIVDFAKSRD